MGNKDDKPKLMSYELVNKMKNEKGIRFEIVSEDYAAFYLENINNYMRTTAYRKNYQQYLNGKNKGKYIDLDFAYLKELSTIDMHFRFLVTKMCLDIEHALKVQILKDIENNGTTDGYDIVKDFLELNTYIIKKLEATNSSPFTSNLIHKYFTLSKNSKGKNTITGYDDCPIWVLLELLTFGDFIKFYDYYHSLGNFVRISKPVINLVKNIRNGAAHNNCILTDLSPNSSKPPAEIKEVVSKINAINQNQRKKKLSSRPMLEFVCLIYVYDIVVSDDIKVHRIEELKNLFFNRMLRNKEYFANNELIKSNYDFACKVINSFFP